MVDATISRVRVRELARRGRFHPDGGRGTASRRACASQRENGTDLAWLQTSEIGESAYRGLGFRHVEMHVMLVRPSPQLS
jgi:hypothetical protein